jgi:tetratricopeptide (TPR) repeat protein
MQLLVKCSLRPITALAILFYATLPASSQTLGARVNPDLILTDDVITRILGFEKDDLTVPTTIGTDENSKARVEEIRKLRTLFAEGITAFRAGNGDAALVKFDEAVKLDAGLAPADVYLARLCFAVNDPNVVQLGRSVLNRAADKNPNAPESYMMLGNLALAEGRLTDAYVLFEKAGMLLQGPFPKWNEKKLNLYRKSVFSGRVSVCEQRQNWEQGLYEVQNWIALDPKDPVALFREARLTFMKNPKEPSNVVEARKLFDEAYDLAVEAKKESDALVAVPPAELALLELQTAVGEPEKGREEIKRLDDKDADWEKNKREGSRVYSTVSQWYLSQGEFKKAEDYAAKATALDHDSQALKQLTAVLHYYAGDPQAEVEFTKMNQDTPDDFFASNFLALVLSDAKTAEGKPDELKRAKAVRIAEINARLNPKSPVAISTLGWAYFNAGRIGEAAQLFGALEQQQNLQVSPDTAYYMAKTFAALPSSQFPNALNRAKSLLELAVQSTGTFRHGVEAAKWLEALGGTVPARNTTVAVDTAKKTADDKKKTDE